MNVEIVVLKCQKCNAITNKFLNVYKSLGLRMISKCLCICLCLFVGHGVSPHHPDCMPQGGQVSMVVVFKSVEYL